MVYLLRIHLIVRDGVVSGKKNGKYKRFTDKKENVSPERYFKWYLMKLVDNIYESLKTNDGNE